MVKKKSRSGRPASKDGTGKPGLDFGIFGFQEFADWLANSHGACAAWMIRKAMTASAWEEAGEDLTLAEAYLSNGLIKAIDMTYLAMLALAFKYSFHHDHKRGSHLPGVLMEELAFRRAKDMLRFHADHLKVEIDHDPDDDDDTSSLLGQRADTAARLLMPASMMGFHNDIPKLRGIPSKLPAPVRSAWEEGEHPEAPVCQMMALSFWLAFLEIAGNKRSKMWRRVVDDFWEDWTKHLLVFEFALLEEDLDFVNTLEKRKNKRRKH